MRDSDNKDDRPDGGRGLVIRWPKGPVSPEAKEEAPQAAETESEADDDSETIPVMGAPALSNGNYRTDESRSGEFVVVRQHLSCAHLPKTGGAERLTELYRYWRSLAGNDDLPEDVAPEAVNGIGLMGNVHIVDTTCDNSGGYFFRLYGSRSRFLSGKDFTGLKLGDFENPLYGRVTQDDYATVVYTGLPRFQFLHTETPVGVSNRYRLILPLSRSGYKIDKLVVAWEYTRAKLL